MILPAAKGSDLKGRAQPRIYKRRGRSDPQSTQFSILQTLKYSDHFSFPLTLSEIHLRLISSDPCSLERVIGTLRLMLKKNLIQKTSNFYHLPGRATLVVRRLSRLKLSSPQLKRAHALASRLRHTPGILAIYLTGSLAMSNSGKNSDIDFMVITQPGRLWTTRLLLTLYTELLGLRRHPQSTGNAGKLCLNLYLTPATYALPNHKQSLYTAYELLQAVPLYDPHHTRPQLLAANPWIHNLLPNLPKRAVLKRNSCDLTPRSDLLSKPRPGGVFSRLQNTIGRPGQTLLELIEFLAYHFQLAYMRPRLTRELITPSSAFFHPHDPSPKV